MFLALAHTRRYSLTFSPYTFSNKFKLTQVFRTSHTLSFVMPKRKRTAVGSVDISQNDSQAVEPTTTQRVRTKSPKKKVKKAVDDDDAWDPYGDTTTSIPLIKPGPDREDSPLTDLDTEFEPKKGKKGASGKRRRKKNDEPVVYDIPPVERKTIDYKGACALLCILVNIALIT
jgi:UV DNA damage endonuclease